MIEFKPFNAYFPDNEGQSRISIRSYHDYSEAELEKLHSNKNSFANVINPEYYSEIKTANLNQRFENVRQEFLNHIENNHLKQGSAECYYLYQKSNDTESFTGIVGLIDTEDYLNDKIKKHEATLSQREKMFSNYLKKCGFHAEPVLLTHRSDTNLNLVFQKIKEESEVVLEFSSSYHHHKVWRVNKNFEKEIASIYKNKNELYIADGHHRCASSAKLYQEEQEDKYRYILSIIIPENQLKIYDFNRLIKAPNLDIENLLSQVSNNFEITKCSDNFSPNRYEFLMYVKNQFYSLKYKNTNENKSIADSLDPQILSDYVLDPIFKIVDLKNDKRVSFLSGKKGLETLIKNVDNGTADVAFKLFPVSFDELIAVADENAIMPPKSTWIAPKLRTGLFIYRFL